MGRHRNSWKSAAHWSNVIPSVELAPALRGGEIVMRSELLKKLDNIFVPMFTPFAAGDGTINEPQLRANTQFLVEQGIRILNPAGTTGEFWTLTPAEHRTVVRTVIDEAKSIDPSIVVVAGISTPNLAMTLDIAKFASSCGADLLQLTPTYYLPMPVDDVVMYYKTISEAIDTPLMIYEIPPATGVEFDCALLERICELCPNVVALKTASPVSAPWEFERIMRRFSGRLSVFAATGAYYAPFTYMTGVRGVTDTLANAIPEFGLSLHRLARASQWEEMNRIYHDAFDVLEIEILYGRAGLKEIGSICGLNLGSPRYPMSNSLTGNDRSDIRRRVESWSFGRKRLEQLA
jgi:4-hydroxy-tetrahydrodipicolinate synthase